MANPKVTVDVEGIEDKRLTMEAQGISDYSVNELGLSYPDIRYHIVDIETITSITAAHGSPVAPQTWQLEQEGVYLFERQKLMGGGVAEIVNCTVGPRDSRGDYVEPIDAFIANTDAPYLMKLVISHVTGHAHVAANNLVSRRVKEASGCYSPHSATVELTAMIEDLYRTYGIGQVSEVLDAVEVIASMVPMDPRLGLPDTNMLDASSGSRALRRKADIWEEMLNPVEEAARSAVAKRRQRKAAPPERVDDIFEVIERSYALEPWQRNLVSKARRMEEYRTRLVAPVKVLHEGFSSLVQVRLASERPDIVPDGEFLNYMKSSASTMRHSKTGLNPYGFGYDILSNVMRQWSNGEFGIEFDMETSTLKRLNWSSSEDLKRGWDKVLDIASSLNDFEMISRHFDLDFFRRHGQNFYEFEEKNYGYWDRTGTHSISIGVIASREFDEIKRGLLINYLNGGRPYFCIEPGNADYEGRGELMVTHLVEPLPELFGYARERFTLDVRGVESMLMALHSLWKRHVHLKTVNERGQDLYISYNGIRDGRHSFSEHLNKREV